MKTIKTVVEYIQNYLKEYDWMEINYDALYEVVENEVMDFVSLSLDEEEVKELYSRNKEGWFVDNFSNSKFGEEEYELLLTSIEQDMVTEMVSEIENV